MTKKDIFETFFRCVSQHAGEIYSFLPRAVKEGRKGKGLIIESINDEVIEKLEGWKTEDYAYLAFLSSSFSDMCSVVDPESEYLKKIFLKIDIMEVFGIDE